MKKVRNQAGTSLIEALIAVVIVSFGILGLTRLQATLHVNGLVAKSRTQAQMYARGILDSMGALPAPATYGNGSDSVSAAATSFVRTWSVATNVVGGATGTVNIAWTDARGAADRVVLSSVFGKDIATNEGLLLSSYGGLPAAAGVTRVLLSPPWTPYYPNSTTLPPVTNPPPPLAPVALASPPTSFTISGSLVTTGRASLTTVSVSAATTCFLTGSAYSCTVPINWSGTLSVSSAASQTVTPAARTYSHVTANVSNVNFTINK